MLEYGLGIVKGMYAPVDSKPKHFGEHGVFVLAL